MPAWTPSSPCQSWLTLPVATSSVEIALDPPTYSTIWIFDGDCQVYVLTEVGRRAVRSLALPPAAGMVIRSPPVEPSSLIRPPMNAIVAPSGDHRGSAICSAGLWIIVTAAPSAP